MSKGKYIVIEGIDGSGKSTQLELLKNILIERNIPFYKNIEPSSNPIGRFIRETILSGKYETNELVRQMLFLTDRLDNFYNGRFSLENLLKEGNLIISDRSFLSGIVYGGEDGEYIHHALFDYIILPDLIIYLDITPEEVMKRIDSNRGDKEIYETLEQQIKFEERYKLNLDILIRMKGIRVLYVQADLFPDTISRVIWRSVNDIL